MTSISAINDYRNPTNKKQTIVASWAEIDTGISHVMQMRSMFNTAEAIARLQCKNLECNGIRQNFALFQVGRTHFEHLRLMLNGRIVGLKMRDFDHIGQQLRWPIVGPVNGKQ